MRFRNYSVYENLLIKIPKLREWWLKEMEETWWWVCATEIEWERR